MPGRSLELTGLLADGGRLTMRRLTRADKEEYLALRGQNAQWLRPWDPTNPDGQPRVVSFARLVREQRQEMRAGRLLAFALVLDGQMAGQLNVANIVEGAARSCTMGYWVGEEFAGRGLTPLAVALAGDHVLRHRGLHRIEINIRPENAASLAVVRKLGFREEGMRQDYLHIAGAWRDHLSFALTSGEIGPDGLAARLTPS